MWERGGRVNIRLSRREIKREEEKKGHERERERERERTGARGFHSIISTFEASFRILKQFFS
jgi:hypothetical protein